MHKKANVRTLMMRDRSRIDSLRRRLPKKKGQRPWFNTFVEKRFCSPKTRSLKGFDALCKTLEVKGLFDINIEDRRCVDSDGRRYKLTLARAASTAMWPMGTHYWLRDNAIIGARMARYGSPRDRRIGLALLRSGLVFISSCAQLNRFRTVIRSAKKTDRHDPLAWPHIFTEIETNLMTKKVEPWSHKQDAWQILAWYVLDYLERGDISVDDLTEKNREFLGLIIPFLASISFWRCENSGSWEELPAVRTSVRAWEHRLVVRLGVLARRREFSFIRSICRRESAYLRPALRKLSFVELVDKMNRLASRAMLRDLPYESPHYARHDPRYRENDSALLYLLEIDYVSFLANQLGRDLQWARRMEGRLLRQVMELRDPLVGGFARYKNDSYQRVGFFREVTAERLRAMYGGPSGDASSDFVGRDKIVPAGRVAVWTHFVWQVAVWSGRRFLETREASLRQLHEEFLEQGMKLITGASRSIDYSLTGRARIIRIRSFRMPECYISEKDKSGRDLVFPSPHTPLNWAVAEMRAAMAVHREVLLLD